MDAFGRVVAAAALIAGFTTAQDKPRFWDQFVQRVELIRQWNRDPEAPVPWPEPDKWAAQVAWVRNHGVLFFQMGAIDGAEAMRIVTDAHLAHRRLVVDYEPGEVCDLCNLTSWLHDRGQGQLAIRAYEELVLPFANEQHSQFADACLIASYRYRRAFRWADAQAALDRADATAATDTQRLDAAINRAALALERGLPDAAITAIDKARQLADDMAEGDVMQLARMCLVELRLETALDRAEAAVARLHAFERDTAAALLRRDGGAHRMSQLRIRAAMAVLQDPEADGSAAEQAVTWLRAALSPGAASADEQALARNVLLTHLLNQGQFAAAERQLAAARGDAERTELDERHLHLAALAVRHARLARLPDEALRTRHRALERLVDDMLTRWSEQPVGRSGLGPLFFDDRRLALTELVSATLALEPGTAGIDAALRHLLRAQTLGSLARSLGADTPTLAEVHDRLTTPGRCLLVFVPGVATTHVFALRDGIAHRVELKTGGLSIDRLRRALAAAILDTRDRSDAAALTEVVEARTRLSNALLPSAVQTLLADCPRLTIVGLESLGYVPFELLDDADGRPLGLRCTINYLPSLPVGVWLARNRPPAPPRKAGVARVLLAVCPDLAPPAGQGSRQPLPFGDRERSQLARGLRAADSQWLTGSEATFVAITSQQLADYDAVHILAHGVRDGRRPDPQGIALADGTLWGPEFERQRLPGLTIVTACRAGRGPLRRGDDGRHIWSGASLIGGARAAVQPRLEIDYRQTLAFSTAMHHALWSEGLSPEEAMRRARQTAFAEDPDAIDPFLFHLVGLGDTPLAEPAPDPSSLRPVLAAAAAAAVVFLVWLAHRVRRRRSATR